MNDSPTVTDIQFNKWRRLHGTTNGCTTEVLPGYNILQNQVFFQGNYLTLNPVQECHLEDGKRRAYTRGVICLVRKVMIRLIVQWNLGIK